VFCGDALVDGATSLAFGSDGRYQHLASDGSVVGGGHDDVVDSGLQADPGVRLQYQLNLVDDNGLSYTGNDVELFDTPQALDRLLRLRRLGQALGSLSRT
jgi:hypothetical protein